MRKTLILVAAVLTAGSLAACKPFWQKDPPPAPTAETTSAETTQTAESVNVDPSKPVENTIPVEAAKAAPEAKPSTPAVK